MSFDHFDVIATEVDAIVERLLVELATHLNEQVRNLRAVVQILECVDDIVGLIAIESRREPRGQAGLP